MNDNIPVAKSPSVISEAQGSVKAITELFEKAAANAKDSPDKLSLTKKPKTPPEQLVLEEPKASNPVELSPPPPEAPALVETVAPAKSTPDKLSLTAQPAAIVETVAPPKATPDKVSLTAQPAEGTSPSPNHNATPLPPLEQTQNTENRDGQVLATELEEQLKTHIEEGKMEGEIEEPVTMVEAQGATSSPKNIDSKIEDVLLTLEPQGNTIGNHVDELNGELKQLTGDIEKSNIPVTESKIEKIAEMSRILTNETNSLRQSIKSLSKDIAHTKYDLNIKNCDFPYHLFLMEIIVNRIQMKCHCLDFDMRNLLIQATFLGKSLDIVCDKAFMNMQSFQKVNAGKSVLFAMTFDIICNIKDFIIELVLAKRPPCSHCTTKIAETKMDFSKEFTDLRDELCSKIRDNKTRDNVICTSSTPLLKNSFYLSCGQGEYMETVGVIDISVRMSFLGKEITTAFCPNPKSKCNPKCPSRNGISMYSCQEVEMDDTTGKILLDEDVMAKKQREYKSYVCMSASNQSQSPSKMSECSCRKTSPTMQYQKPFQDPPATGIYYYVSENSHCLCISLQL